MNKHSKVIITLLSLGSLLLLFFHMKTLKTNSELETNLKILKKEKISLLTEHETCLKEKEETLKKDLTSRYLDYMIDLRNKLEAGYVPGEKEVKDFSDRNKFVVENINLLKLTTKESTQYLTFLAKMNKLVDEVLKKQPKNNSEIQK